MENLLKGTKLVYSCFVDGGGHINRVPTGKIARLNLSQDITDFLYRYINFILGTRLLNEASMIYIQSPYDSMKSVFAYYNEQHKTKPVNIKTAMSNLDYNRKKLNKIFDEDMLDNLIYHAPFKGLPMLSHYNEQLAGAMEQYSPGSIFDGKLMIKLSKQKDMVQPTDQEIDDFMDVVSVYRSMDKKITEKAINEQFLTVISFFNFLSTQTTMTEWQREKWNRMQDFLNCSRTDSEYSDHIDQLD